MRILLLLSLFSLNVSAQIDPGTGSDGPCDQDTIAVGGIFNCSTFITNNSRVYSYVTNPIVVKVQGIVEIKHALTLNGQSGGYGSSVPGGQGGPGAGAGGPNPGGPNPGSGGGYLFGTQDSPDIPNGGYSGDNDGSCGDGGGGGSFFSLGDDGVPTCTGGGTPPRGEAGTTTYDPTVALFSGGFGGGSGGESPFGEAGAAGGGGGALHIMAGGDILITAPLSANGGNGGSANNTQFGGGGGGGSGGVIWIQSLGQVTNNALISVNGGQGGTSPNGGNGGDGGSGIFKLEDSDGIIKGTGSGTSGIFSSSKLTSDISCGTVLPLQRTNSHSLYQVLVGFLFVILLRTASKRFRSLKLFS